MTPRLAYCLLALTVISLAGFIWWQELDFDRQAVQNRPLPNLREASQSRLVPCTACRREISRAAASCPHCGDPR